MKYNLSTDVLIYIQIEDNIVIPKRFLSTVDPILHFLHLEGELLLSQVKYEMTCLYLEINNPAIICSKMFLQVIFYLGWHGWG